MKKELTISLEKRQFTFLDEIWPDIRQQQQVESPELDTLYDDDQNKQQPTIPRQLLEDDDHDEIYGWTELRIWRVQTILAISPWGIPLVTFGKVYEKIYNRKFRTQEFGHAVLIDMVSERPDIFAIQEPDELTEIIFPEYPHDKILHDARYGNHFNNDRLPNSHASPSATLYDRNELNYDELISIAWLNRDDDFPNDVVLAGEEYCDLFLPIPEAKLPDTYGVYKAIIIGVASPHCIYINIQSPDSKKVVNLSVDVKDYFSRAKDPIDMYRVPKEFLYPGFPCLVFVDEDKSWERGIVIGQASRGDRVLVETVDYGGVRAVSGQQLYLMPKKYMEFPPQAILVSLFGLKPAHDEDKWNPRAGTRLRSFSYPEYYLDVLLMPSTAPEPKSRPKKQQEEKSSTSEQQTITSATSTETKGLDNGLDSSEPPVSSRVNVNSRLLNKLKNRKTPQYDAIICDRNDDQGFDLYLHNLMIVETYAEPDMKKYTRLKELQDGLKVAFKKVSRPINPMIGLFFDKVEK